VGDSAWFAFGLAAVLACACTHPGPGATVPASDAGSASDWQTVVHAGPTQFRALSLDGPGVIYTVAVADGAFIPNVVVSSLDGGATWTTASVGDTRAPLLAVAGVGATDVYAVGLATEVGNVADEHPFVARSTDNGKTFAPSYPTFAGGLYAAAADGAGNLLAVGSAADGGFFVRTDDGGATWTRTVVPGTSGLGGVWVAASGVIYACGRATPGAGPADGGASADGGAPAEPPGVVVRSLDGGATWSTMTSAPAPLFSVSGTLDGARVVAVGRGFTMVESFDGGATWSVDAGDPGFEDRNFSDLGSVWVADAVSGQYIAAGNAGYVVRSVSQERPGDPLAETSEDLPAAGNGVQSGAIAVAGTGPSDVWAVGSGIFHRTSR
jgi:hypothetical protein